MCLAIVGVWPWWVWFNCRLDVALVGVVELISVTEGVGCGQKVGVFSTINF